MQIWWGWRLAFDCTCLWGFLHFFSLCKYHRPAHSETNEASLSHRPTTRAYMLVAVPFYEANLAFDVRRPNCHVEI